MFQSLISSLLNILDKSVIFLMKPSVTEQAAAVEVEPCTCIHTGIGQLWGFFFFLCVCACVCNNFVSYDVIS